MLVIGGYFFTLYVIHGFSPDFLEINNCVESGGRWNAKERHCEKFYELSAPQEPARSLGGE